MRIGSVLLWTLGFLTAAAPGAAAGSPEEVAPALRSIEQLRASGDVEGAAKQATALVAQHPEDLQAHLAYQDLQLALGHEKEVLDAYRSAAKAEGASADSHYLLSRLLRGPAAIAELRAAVKADPNHFWSLCALGGELTRAKSWADAKSSLDAAAKLRPDSAIPLNALGRLEEARGKAADAEKLYRAALTISPEMIVARVNLGVLLVGMGRHDDAVKELTDAASRAPKDPMPLMGLGIAFMAVKDSATAAAQFKRAVAVDAGNVTSLNLLANAYLNLDQWDLCEEALKEAQKRAPDSLLTKVNYAHLRIAREQYDEAAKFAMSAIQTDDTSAEAHYVLGLVYDHQQLARKAEAEFHRAEKLDEENPVYARAVAALAASQADWKTAISEYQKVAKMTDASGDSLMELADAYVGAEKPKLAASTYEQVIAAEPKRLEALLQLGIVCQRDLKDYKRAAKTFREYQKRGGTDPRVAGWIAACDAK